jgi:TolB-like protein/cytochrome c-type biogenesis protein CcmH/NrfG
VSAEPPASRAVFLSYASQDAGPARRICEALRAAGAEVWFDQSELRGGDQWDAKIKKQIRECALFLPVISANTNARLEGYFRREWKLAVERTHDMADEKAFLVPVVIDATSDAAASVPEKFREVQWTRLRDGETPPAFCDRVKELLVGVSPISAANRESPAAAAKSEPRRGFRLFLRGTIAVVLVVAGIGKWLLRSRVPDAVEQPAATAKQVQTVLPGDKSIAVLPFKNLSDDQDANAFFATGIHEDILTNLAHVRALRVVSRTSMERYRNGNKTLREIGAELGVAWVLEGSVQRAGNKVHVTGQLINARTDEHVWADNYNRDLTDVFAVQAELATAIVSALQAALSPEEKAAIVRQPTRNPAAYDFYLRGRESLNHDTIADGPILDKQEAFFQSAVDLDPEFAEAWAELAFIHAFKVFGGRDQSAGRAARAKSAIERAVHLAPDSPDVIRLLGMYYYYSARDYARADEQFQKVIRLQPNDATTYYSLGLIQRRQDQWVESIQNLRKATQLDPGSLTYAYVLASELTTGRRYEEAVVEQRRLAALAPERLGEAYALARLSWLAHGSLREVEDFFSKLSPEQTNSIPALRLRLKWASDRSDADEMLRLDEILARSDPGYLADEFKTLDAAWALMSRGDAEGARVRLGDFPAKLRARVAAEPQNAPQWFVLGQMEAFLGHKAEALRCCAKAVELRPESLDALDGRFCRFIQAEVLAWTGEHDRALAEYAYVFRAPTPMVNVYFMQHDFASRALQADPRFQALLNDPKNNAPLF